MNHYSSRMEMTIQIEILRRRRKPELRFKRVLDFVGPLIYGARYIPFRDQVFLSDAADKLNISLYWLVTHWILAGLLDVHGQFAVFPLFTTQADIDIAVRRSAFSPPPACRRQHEDDE